MTQEWLRRVGTSRLLSYSLYVDGGSLLSEFTRVILPTLIPSTNRWQELYVKLALLNGPMPLSPMIEGAFSSLESFTLSTGVVKGQREPLRICDIFEIAPKLRRVNLAGGIRD
jgi:hypothetical protein